MQVGCVIFISNCYVELDNMQFGFMKGKGLIEAIFVVRQMQEKFRVRSKKPTLDLWIWKKHLIGYQER